jgi:hypothetical protein
MIRIREEIEISKDKDTIWNILTDVISWRLWSRVIDRAVIYGQISPGTRFKCRAGKWDLDCSIVESIPSSLLKCAGKTVGIAAEFTWQFHDTGASTKVSLEIQAAGPLVGLLRKRVAKGFEGASFAWLYALKTAAERGFSGAASENSRRRAKQKKRIKINFVRPFEFDLPSGRRKTDHED